MRHDDSLAIPTERLRSRLSYWCAVDERQPPFQRRAGLVLREPVEAREEAKPSPMLAECSLRLVGRALLSHHVLRRRRVVELAQHATTESNNLDVVGGKCCSWTASDGDGGSCSSRATPTAPNRFAMQAHNACPPQLAQPVGAWGVALCLVNTRAAADLVFPSFP